VAQELPASFVQAYAQSRSDYRLSAEERAAAWQQVGPDGLWLLERLEATAPAALRDLEAIQVLRTAWEQRYERVEGRVRVRAKTVDCTALIVTPHDPGVRAGEKRGQKWRGDKVHVTETAEADRPHFLTDVTTASAPSVDSAALPLIRQHLAERALRPGEQYVDAGYVSGLQLAQSQDAGIDLMGPALPDTTPNQLKIAAFTLDRAAQRAICPQGHASVKWGGSLEPDGSQSVHIQFAAAVCPLRAQCTTGKSGRSLRLSEHYEVVAARRVEAQTEEFRERMRARPAIEATLSELVRKHGLRRQRYRGEAKRHFENLLKGAACNLKRLVRALVARWEQEAAPSARALGRGARVAALPLAA
jgi:Transposase DDE domain